MMNAVVNIPCRCKPELLLDANGDPVTTKSNSDWTKTARLLGTGTTATPTITHVANGIYDIAFTPTQVGNWSVEYSVTVDGETVYFDPQFVQVETAAQADPVAAVGLTSAKVAKLDRIGSGTAVATSPVGADATTLRIDRGDDYTGDNPIPFSEPSTGWPDLSDAQSVALLLLNRVNVAVLTVTGSVVNATPGAQTIAFELTESQTGALNLGPHAYQFRVKAVLANGADRTLALGEVEVRA